MKNFLYQSKDLLQTQLTTKYKIFSIKIVGARDNIFDRASRSRAVLVLTIFTFTFRWSRDHAGIDLNILLFHHATRAGLNLNYFIISPCPAAHAPPWLLMIYSHQLMMRNQLETLVILFDSFKYQFFERGHRLKAFSVLFYL